MVLHCWVVVVVLVSVIFCEEIGVGQLYVDPELVENVIVHNHLREEGYTDFKVVRIHQKYGNHSLSSHLLRRRRSTELEDAPIECQFEAFNKTLDLTLHYNHRLSGYQLPVIIRRNDSLDVSKQQVPDCFMTGMTSQHGAVSLSYCDGISGSILEDDFEYRLDPIGPLTTGFEETILVSRTPANRGVVEAVENYNGPVFDNWYEHNVTRRKRAIPSKSFTIELALFLDQIFWTILESEYNALTTASKIKVVALKWNGVQSLMDLLNADFGYAVTLKIKSIEFWQTNPAWYVFSSTALNDCLASFCSGSQSRTDLLPVDHYHLHTGAQQTGVSGYANMPGQCNAPKCGVSADRSFYGYYVTAHELGHSLGMRHDTSAGCAASGIMDANGCCSDKWISCNLNDMEAFLTDQTKASCLFVENVSSAMVDANIQSITLQGLWPGMVISEDEKCAMKYGAGWEYFDWHKDWGVCNWHSCINMNTGPAYGTMVTQTFKLQGTYCSDGHVCSGSNCITWAATRIPSSKLISVQGGWSAWSAFSSCSKTCGNGMRVKTRICNNPRPQMSAPCPGSRYYAEICSTVPCAGDSATKAELIKQRAGEVCTGFTSSGVLSSAQYDGTGDRLDWDGNGQCIVYCKPKPTFTPESNIRHGLMPPGTPCSGASQTYAESKGFPRVSGLKYYCLQGKCEAFGCDNTNSRTARDFCGVCGGDNTTCQTVDSSFYSAIPLGGPVQLMVLPVGAFMIQMWFPWADMNEVHLELFDATGAVKLSSGQYPYIYDTTSNPATIGGARWYFLWWQQFLYTPDTLTEELTVKIYNKNGVANKGINYGYSLPAAPTTTTTSTSTTTTPTTPTTTTSTTTTTPTTPTTTTSTTTTTPTTPTTTTSTTTTTPTTPTTTTSTTTTTPTTPTTTTSTTTTTPTTPTTTTSTTTPTSTSTSTSTTSTTSSTASTPAPQTTTSVSTSTNIAGSTSRPLGMILCSTGKCITYQDICNGKDDCGDNGDESGFVTCSADTIRRSIWMMILLATSITSLF